MRCSIVAILYIIYLDLETIRIRKDIIVAMTGNCDIY